MIWRPTLMLASSQKRKYEWRKTVAQLLRLLQCLPLLRVSWRYQSRSRCLGEHQNLVLEGFPDSENELKFSPSCFHFIRSNPCSLMLLCRGVFYGEHFSSDSSGCKRKKHCARTTTAIADPWCSIVVSGRCLQIKWNQMRINWRWALSRVFEKYDIC